MAFQKHTLEYLLLTVLKSAVNEGGAAIVLTLLWLPGNTELQRCSCIATLGAG